MFNIVQAEKHISQDALDKAKVELVEGHYQKLAASEWQREQSARAEASLIKNHKSIPGLGKCVAKIPAEDFFALVRKYGYDGVHNKEFLQYFNKKFPDLSPNRA